MAPSIRGHQSQVRLLKNGQQSEIVSITSFEASQESSFYRSNYVGAALPEGDQSQEGWSGTFEMEVKDARVDELIDAMVTQNLAGVGVDTINIVDTENYPDGTTKSWVYVDVQVKMSKRAGGLNEKVTKRLEWQAAFRQPLN